MIRNIMWGMAFATTFSLGGIASILIILHFNKVYGLSGVNVPAAVPKDNNLINSEGPISAPLAVPNKPVSTSLSLGINNNSVPLNDFNLITLTNKSSILSVYNGPGSIQNHINFEKWLGKPVLYATDYIDYKGGWQKDFVDSKVWLMEPWGKWVKNKEGRRLVLGLPMLQNENYGQFNEGIRGDFDQHFISLGNELVKQNLGNTILRLGYEANCDTIGPWQATDNPDDYKLLFRHLVTVLKKVPDNNFAFDWTVCNGLQTSKYLNSFQSFYPGNDVVDIIGIDVYDVKWQDKTVTPEDRWQYTLNRNMGVMELINFSRSNGKPVSFPEWGLYGPGDNFAGGGDNPYFISKMTELFNITNPVYQSYFNLNWGGGILSDFSQGEVAYKFIFGM